MKTKINIHTDGACTKTGSGGGAAYFEEYGAVFWLEGSETTNNRMELLPVIKALTLLTSEVKDMYFEEEIDEVLISSDSQYVTKGATEWLQNWKKNNWKNSSRGDVKNRDLWEQLDLLLNTLKLENVKVRFMWVKGHNGAPGNELVDYVANTVSLRRSIDLLPESVTLFNF